MAIINNTLNLLNKKVIIADVDDTICDSCQQISPDMADQINSMINSGYSFAFISGTKSNDLINMISTKVNHEHHVLGTTGTNYTLVNSRDELEQINSREIYNHNFTLGEKEEIINALEKLIEHYNIKSMTTKEDQLQDRDSQITLSAIGRHASSKLKAEFDPDCKRRIEWINFLRKDLPEDRYDIRAGGTTSVDITRKGLDKEWGIREFCKNKGITFDEILFFGDKLHGGGNDYPASRIVDCISVKSPKDTLRHLKELVSF